MLCTAHCFTPPRSDCGRVTPFAPAMADQFKARTLKRKNVKGLALNSTPKPLPKPSEGDAQIPGAIGNTDSNRTDTLEIGLEFRLDLRSEDLITLKELGAGNGGTVSKVMHASTKVVMARKVWVVIPDQRKEGSFVDDGLRIMLDCRSFAWMPRRM